MKAYTDLEQSKKLAEILSLESADMRYAPFGDTHPWVWDEEVKLLEKGSIPCWSLAALLAVLPEYTLKNSKFYETVALWCQGISVECDNIVDACYELILKLCELKML